MHNSTQTDSPLRMCSETQTTASPFSSSPPLAVIATLELRMKAIEIENDKLKSEVQSLKTINDQLTTRIFSLEDDNKSFELMINELKKGSSQSTCDSYPPPTCDDADVDGGQWVVIGSSRIWTRNVNELKETRVEPKRNLKNRKRRDRKRNKPSSVASECSRPTEPVVRPTPNPTPPSVTEDEPDEFVLPDTESQRRGWVFVSRCPKTTTESDIVDHVKSRFKITAKCVPLVRKGGNLERTDYISFKVRFPISMMSSALDKRNWPHGCLIREFKDNNKGENRNFLWEKPQQNGNGR